jgi:hypothetical protein
LGNSSTSNGTSSNTGNIKDKGGFSFIKKDINSVNKQPEPIHTTNNDLLGVFDNVNINKAESPDKNKKAGGFSFIKAKSSVQPKSELESIFSTANTENNITTKSVNTIPAFDLTKSNIVMNVDYTVGIDDIFSKQPVVDVGRVTQNYRQSFDGSHETGKYEAPNLDKLMQNSFNYDQVYNTIETTGRPVKKDPFSFVDDMLKKK